MKKFSSIHELWNRCSFCPICNEHCRKIVISVGPDQVLQLISTEYSDQFLQLHCVYSYKLTRQKISFDINCQDNSFSVSFNEGYEGAVPVLTSDNVLASSSPYFYFYIQSHCPVCKGASAFSLDAELNFLERRVHNIGLECETTVYDFNHNQYYVEMKYDEQTMEISINSSRKYIKLPLANLDFSDLEKATNKIKTLILFS